MSVNHSRNEFTPAEIASYYDLRTPKVRQHGQEWRGHCPLHNGKRDSFAINAQTGAWFCHSKCGRGGSLIDFEIEVSGKPFAEAAAEVRAIVGKMDRPPKGTIISTYDYVDEEGQTLFQCVRYQPKEFKQRRPNGRGG